MIEHLEVNPGHLANAAADISVAAGAIDDLLDALRAEAAVLSTQWHGDAQQAFAEAQAGFDTRATARADLLRLLCRSLDALAIAYTDADLAGARALGADA